MLFLLFLLFLNIIQNLKERIGNAPPSHPSFDIRDWLCTYIYCRVAEALCKPSIRLKCSQIKSIIIPINLYQAIFLKYDGKRFDGLKLQLYQSSRYTWNTQPNGVQKGFVPNSFMHKKVFGLDGDMVGFDGVYQRRITPGSYNIKYSQNTNSLCISYHFQSRRQGRHHVWNGIREPIYHPISTSSARYKSFQRKPHLTNMTEKRKTQLRRHLQ